MKRFFSFCLALVLVLSLAGCSGGGKGSGTSQGVQDTQTDKGLEVMGDNVTYDPNHLVNDGEPITIDWWGSGQQRICSEVSPKLIRRFIPT